MQHYMLVHQKQLIVEQEQVLLIHPLVLEVLLFQTVIVIMIIFPAVVLINIVAVELVKHHLCIFFQELLEKYNSAQLSPLLVVALILGLSLQQLQFKPPHLVMNMVNNVYIINLCIFWALHNKSFLHKKWFSYCAKPIFWNVCFFEDRKV